MSFRARFGVMSGVIFRARLGAMFETRFGAMFEARFGAMFGKIQGEAQGDLLVMT